MSYDTRSGYIYRYNSQTDKLHMSYTVVKRSKLTLPGRLVIDAFRLLRLVHVRESKAGSEEVIECSNMTIINLALNVLGPTHEASLTIYLLILQVRISVLRIWKYRWKKSYYNFTTNRCAHCTRLYGHFIEMKIVDDISAHCRVWYRYDNNIFQTHHTHYSNHYTVYTLQMPIT